MRSLSPVVVYVAVNRTWSIAVDLSAPNLRVSRVRDPRNTNQLWPEIIQSTGLVAWKLWQKPLYRQLPVNRGTNAIDFFLSSF